MRISTPLNLDSRILEKLIETLRKWMIFPRSSLNGVIRELEQQSWPSRKEFRYIVHYFVEIIRYWSSIHFVVNKTNRSLKFMFKNADKNPWLYLLTYMIVWENEFITTQELTKVFSPSELKLFDRFVQQLQNFSWNIAFEDKTDIERLSIQEAIPTFVIEHLKPVLSWDRIQAEIHALNIDPTDIHTTFRINLLALYSSPQNEEKLLENIMEIEESLNNQKINFKKDTEIPFLYHISTLQRQNLMHNDFYKKNVLIFQDKASVTVAMIVDPQPEDLILDLTAAPGMKTILISQLANCQAKIIAIDIQSDRCRLMKELTQNLHSEDIHLLNADGLHPPFRVIQETRFNRILLDAPCTGSGTFLLSPDLKWQQNQQFLARNVLLQQKLLISALEYLNPGGFLIYSTCSLFPEEGEHQILQIQTDENWKDRIELNNLPNWILPSYTFPNLSSVGMGRLFPSIHHTQGFFIAKIRKKK